MMWSGGGTQPDNGECASKKEKEIATMPKKKTNRIQDARKAAVDVVNKGKKQLRKTIEGNAKEIRKSLTDNVEETRKQAQNMSLDATLGVINLQKRAFDASFKALSKLELQAEKSVQQMVKKSAWLPAESKEVVDDWAKMLKTGRDDFQKTVDKSFDLMTKFIKRVQHEGVAGKHKSHAKAAVVRKRVTVKKKAAKKKAPAKKKAAPAAG